jgi:hypothetical protein
MEREILTQALRPGVDCPALEVLGRYADDTLPPAERNATAEHVGSCAVCQSELALLQTFADGEIRSDERDAVNAVVAELRRRESEILPPSALPEIRQSASGWFGSFRLAVSGAVVLLAVVGGYFFFETTPPRLPSNVSNDGGATRSLAVDLRAPIGDQVAVPQRLEWRPVSGAVRYRVRLMEVDRRELWSIESTPSAVDLPEDIRALIAPAKTLQWQVTAYDASNTPIAESRPERFRLIRR